MQRRSFCHTRNSHARVYSSAKFLVARDPAENRRPAGRPGIATDGAKRRQDPAFVGSGSKRELSSSGWARYFSYGTHRAAFRGIDYYVYERVRDFLARRHKIKGRGTNRFSYNVVYGEREVLRLERLPWSLAPCASR